MFRFWKQKPPSADALAKLTQHLAVIDAFADREVLSMGVRAMLRDLARLTREQQFPVLVLVFRLGLPKRLRRSLECFLGLWFKLNWDSWTAWCKSLQMCLDRMNRSIDPALARLFLPAQTGSGHRRLRVLPTGRWVKPDGFPKKS
jgi:hypothetical protein